MFILVQATSIFAYPLINKWLNNPCTYSQEPGAKGHRGIGFITYQSSGKLFSFAILFLMGILSMLICVFSSKTIYNKYFIDLTDSVDKLMDESHELGGSTVVVDRATPKVPSTCLL